MIQQPIPKPRKRRGKCALIDVDAVRKMVTEGYSLSSIAEAFGVSDKGISGICRDHGIEPQQYLANRPRLERQFAETPAPKPAPIHPPRLAALIATGGRYADLAAWAREWGVTERKALQEWLALRLPVRKGGAV